MHATGGVAWRTMTPRSVQDHCTMQTSLRSSQSAGKQVWFVHRCRCGSVQSVRVTVLLIGHQLMAVAKLISTQSVVLVVHNSQHNATGRTTQHGLASKPRQLRSHLLAPLFRARHRRTTRWGLLRCICGLCVLVQVWWRPPQQQVKVLHHHRMQLMGKAPVAVANGCQHCAHMLQTRGAWGSYRRAWGCCRC